MHAHQFSYVIIECHYTGRLLTARGSPVRAMKRAESMHDCMIVYVDCDDGECDQDYETEDVGPVFEALGRPRGDAVVIKTSSLGSAMGFVNDIMKIKHCGFFTWGSLFEQSFGVTALAAPEGIMHMLFDTESG